MFHGFRTRFAAAGAALLLCTGAALMLADGAHARALEVVTTTTDLASLAQAVGGDAVKVSSIASGSQDPHFIDAKPSFMIAARNADLFIEVGMELEIGWEPLILQNSRNDKIQTGNPGHLDASEGIMKLEVPTGQVDRSQGDVHPFGNPHYWVDPWNARVVAASIATRLQQLDPANSADYAQRLTAFQAKLDAAMFGKPLVDALGGETLWKLDLAGNLGTALASEAARRGSALPALGGWAGQLQPAAGSSVLTYHRSWSYLINRFGLTSVGEIEPKPGIAPSASHLVEVIKAASAANAKAILVEPWYSRQAPDLVASKTQAKVVVMAQSVGGDGTADYFALMDHVVSSLAGALATTPARG